MKGSFTWIPIVAALMMVVGCGDESDDAAQKAAPGKAVPIKQASDAKPGGTANSPTKKPVFAYNPVGKRDPFRSYLAEKESSPRESQKIQPTEEFELGQYTLTALVTGSSQPRAMVEDPKGVGHVLRIGSRLGKRGGRISRISNKSIVVVEEIRDPSTLKRVRVPITIKLPKEEIDGVLR